MKAGRVSIHSILSAGVLCALVCMVPAFSHAQDFDRLPVGVRVQAMGGTGVASVAPGEALAINPAWMVAATSGEVVLHTRGRWNSTPPNVNNSLSFSELSSDFNLDYLAILLPQGELYGRPFVAGIHAGTPLGLLYREWDSSGEVYTFGPSLAMQPLEGLNTGISVNIWRGQYNVEAVELPRDPDGGYVAGAPRSDLSGVNATFGLGFSFWVPPSATFLLGMAVQSPLTLELHGRPPIPRDDSNIGEKYKIQLPWQITYGYAFQWKDIVTASFEFEYRPETSDTPGEQRGFRVGGEYVVLLGDARIPVRAGVRSVTTRLFRQNKNSAWGWSCGSGVELNGYRLELAWSSLYQTDYDAYLDQEMRMALPSLSDTELGTLSLGVSMPMPFVPTVN